MYPKGPSVMFYNMFLDENVRSSLSEYDALSTVEWDVLVASDNSFEELYHAALRVNEEFWVKGSKLEGTSFHSSAEASEMWQVLGHINGNAIYNNDDPAFVEYVEYTRARWGYEHPYDVALWMTISDFPYSWPLYQRYSSKFIVTNLVGDGNVASKAAAASTATATADVAKQTRGRKLSGNTPKWKTQEKWRTSKDDSLPKCKRNQKRHTSKDDKVPKWKTNQKWKNKFSDGACSSSCEYTSRDGTRGRVCDANCSTPDVYGTRECNAKQGTYGEERRACFNDVDKARKQDTPENRAIMCSSSCEYTSRDGTRGRVCDANCSTPDVYGTRECNAKQGTYGEERRACFNDVDKAREQDTPENRAIMCSTKRPVEGYGRRLTPDDESDPLRIARSLETLQEDTSSPLQEQEHRQLSGSTPKRRSQEKWRTRKDDSIPKCVFRSGGSASRWKRNQKWQTSKDDKAPKWKTNQRWKNKFSDGACSSSCEYTSRDGTRGRVCDANCSTPDVYGTRGCNAKQGTYGEERRACFNDVDKARKQDTPENRAIMCSTVMPVDVYGRRLTPDDGSRPLREAKIFSVEDSEEEADGVEGELANVDVDREDVISFFEEAAKRPYSQDLKRRNLCAFVSGRVGEETMWEVTVKIILQFMPGMRVAIAAEAEGLDTYERSMGGRPGVTVSGTQNLATASLFADQYCGAGAALILYVKPGSDLSRFFTSKDTHSPRGDLLVVHTGFQGSYHDAQLRRRSVSVLGFDAPSFTDGTDLMLPVGANEDLRESLGLRHGASLQHDGDGASMVALQEMVEFD
ncbi:unnamed protein product [Ectocarpus sp. CCAP 1310/34]|nr:unnamed protein product [Ectocarpus sp. CCAP 1310/34]